MRNILHITTFLNLLGLVLLGLRYHKLEVLHHELEKRQDNMCDASITNINEILSNVVHEVSTIKLERAEQRKNQEIGRMEKDIVDQQPLSSVDSTKSKINNDEGSKIETYVGQLEHFSEIKIKDSNDLEPVAESLPLHRTLNSNKVFNKKYSKLKNRHVKLKTVQRKRRIEAEQDSNDIETKCILMSINNNTTSNHSLHQNISSNESTVFTLDFELYTDYFPKETSWSLFPFDEKEKLIIDSTVEGIDLSQNILYNFKYSCFVTQNSVTDINKKKACYVFTVIDSYGDGNCCWGGAGFYSVKVNDEFLQVSEHGRFYAYEAESKFCLEDQDITSYYHDIESVDLNNTELYPTRECLHEICLCDSKPELLSNHGIIEYRYPGLYELKSRTMKNILILSGTQSIKDTSSPQYMAACWVLNDDKYLTKYNSITSNEADAETRMMQRYILAVHYFSTKPHNWALHLNFLSSETECEWHQSWERGDDSVGIFCDESNNIISFLFLENNLDGPLVDEISGLKSLEFLVLDYEPKVFGTIPTSFSLLSELKYVAMQGLDLQSTLPSELFNATKMERLLISDTSIKGTIPKSISKVKKLQVLELRGNKLTGSIPNEVYSLIQLRKLSLYDNNFSSTISSLIGNLEKLKILRLEQNEFSNSLPSELGSLSMLEEVVLSQNKFTSTIPSSLSSLSNIETLDLRENGLSGNIPYEMCEIKPLPDIMADCRNDIFPPDLSCSCCSYCTDETPTWNGKCPDSKLKFVIDHLQISQWVNSELLEWSITSTVTKQQIMGDGPYKKGLGLHPVYEICVASTDCLSLNMMSQAIKNAHADPQISLVEFKTEYSIYWDDKMVLQDTFESDINESTTQPEVFFQFDLMNNQAQVVPSCSETAIICGDTSNRPTYHQQIYQQTALKVSGASELFNNPESPHSKALCWIINSEESFQQSKENAVLIQQFTQRYVLTLLHIVSVSGLFGDDEFPPLSHECSWEGVKCADGKNTMTSLSLSFDRNQLIGGTLIEEIANLPFLEILHLSQTHLKGTIPSMFSNLYSLREVDLSDNFLTGTISEDFFHQLERLELFDVSNNDMSGEIPVSIGSCSSIEIIRLRNNTFSGKLPLDYFTTYNLKHLDLSLNDLSGRISPSLLKHTNLEYLDLCNNFFVGSLEENTFGNLAKLKHFDVSKNEFTGIIPPSHHYNNVSDITYLDMHANRFTGSLPISISRMTSLEYLNLQGNKITGSLPSQINQLSNLEVLVLSHNQLKGPIPLTLDKIQNMNSLHLQSNQLSGKAPITDKAMKNYITDCGYPSESSNPIDCPSCSICCNSEGLCARQRKTPLRPVVISVIFFLSLLTLIAIIYSIRNRLLNSNSIRRRFEASVMYWKASDMVGDKSVYHFFLTPSTPGWYVGFFCAIAQLATLFLFIRAADIANEGSDLQYTMTCGKNSLECDDEKSRTVYGSLIFSLILSVWLLRDLIGSIKLFILSMWKKNIDFFFASVIILLVTSLSAWTSVYYNLAIATKDTELIVNAVILLFVNELDERVYQLVEALNVSWTNEVDASIQRNSYHEEQKLNIFRGLHKITKRVRNLRPQSPSAIISPSTENNAQDASFSVQSNGSEKKKPVDEFT